MKNKPFRYLIVSIVLIFLSLGQLLMQLRPNDFLTDSERITRDNQAWLFFSIEMVVLIFLLIMSIAGIIKNNNKSDMGKKDVSDK
ncbi:hypothetical protein BVG16_08845 [Paenibacillus selenitireducens]|uniref:Uncharacterized protein n=1 Tax=Paenibacillus selenitireducens TaxID=1324314 RepID=A0A1T2XHQ2_9BACL|nr:hypothetical protein [Paenibacillus selenitireducens]OPA79193.1 hypothetical protein BVG16_08845 [Paenibacillus selenitireducens]